MYSTNPSLAVLQRLRLLVLLPLLLSICHAWPIATSTNTPTTVGDLDDSPMVVQTNDTKKYAADFQLKVQAVNSQLMLSLNIAPMNSVPQDSMTTTDGMTQLCDGNLLLMNASTASATVDWSSIPVISCDDQAVTDQSLSQVMNGNPPCIIMYSLQSQGCNFSQDTSQQGIQLGSVFSLLSRDTAQSLVHQLTKGPVTNEGKVVPNFPNNGQSPGNGAPQATSKPMIVLYTLTGVIGLVFLTLIIMGAIRAHKHPERYGFVTTSVDEDRNNRSNEYDFGSANSQYANRAKGLARAVLDSVPLVRLRLDGQHKQDEENPQSNPSKSKSNVCKDSGDDQNSSHTQDSHVDTKEKCIDEVRSRASSDTYHSAEYPKHLARNIASADTTTTTATTEDSEDSNCTFYPSDLPEYVETADADNSNTACLICFDDFKDGDVLRVLPCKHKFHALCVDQWLLNSSALCPLCRLDVSIQRNEPISDQPPVIAEGMEINTSLVNRFLDFWNAQLLPREARRVALAQFHREAELRRQLRQQRDSAHQEQNRRRWAQFVLSRRIAHLASLHSPRSARSSNDNNNNNNNQDTAQQMTTPDS